MTKEYICAGYSEEKDNSHECHKFINYLAEVPVEERCLAEGSKLPFKLPQRLKETWSSRNASAQNIQKKEREFFEGILKNDQESWLLLLESIVFEPEYKFIYPPLVQVSPFKHYFLPSSNSAGDKNFQAFGIAEYVES